MVRRRQRAGTGKLRDCRSSDEVPDSVQRVRVLPGGGGTEAERPVMNNREPWGGRVEEDSRQREQHLQDLQKLGVAGLK